MANILGTIGKVFKGVTQPWTLALDAGKAVAGLITNNKASKDAAHLTDRQIAAQKEMNQYNIQAQKDINASNIISQEKINQQNIDIAKELNALSRRDAQHAISDKRTDLMRAGYSSASPDLSGFSPASLTSPQLTAPQSVAPQMQSEFTPDMANSLINSKSSSINSAVQMATALADIALKRAQTSKTKAEEIGLTKSNSWLDLEKQSAYALTLQNIENAVLDGKIKEHQGELLVQEISTFNTRFDTLKAQLESIEITNKSLDERFRAELAQTLAQVDKIIADTANVKADTANKKIENSLLRLDKQLKDIELKFAKLGINFHANDLFSSIARIAVQGSGSDILTSVLTSVQQMVGTLTEALLAGGVEVVKRGAKHVADGVKSALGFD